MPDRLWAKRCVIPTSPQRVWGDLERTKTCKVTRNCEKHLKPVLKLTDLPTNFYWLV